MNLDEEKNAVDTKTDIEFQVALAIEFADAMTIDGRIADLDDGNLQNAFHGLSVLLMRVSAFLAAIDHRTLQLRPITWEEMHPVQVRN